MTEPQPEVIAEVITPAGREHAEHQAADKAAREQAANPDIPPAARAFAEKLLGGTLPDPGDVPELDPQVIKLAEELKIIHLPEWRNGAGRKLADPTITQINGAIRVADYLFRRGVRIHPELERIRWIPTPDGPREHYDLGLHVTPDDDGHWPAVDPEQFWDVTDAAVQRNPAGDWTAIHPRGVEFTASSKSEAYAGLVYRLRQKIEEAQQR